jgi:branched-chain amino acid transport system substrate-binding protein
MIHPLRKALALVAPLVLASLGGVAAADDPPGVTATEIKIGQTMPYSGPASAYGAIGKGEVAFFKLLNDKGGVSGRKVTLLSVDDSYSPPKTVEQARKLVESDGVAFLFNPLGTASNAAIQKYLNQKKVPQLFVATGADRWGDPKGFPWTMGWQPSYRVEAKIYGKYLLKEKPGARICVLRQNDDFGKDYVVGLHEALGDRFDKMVVKEVSYEVTDPTVDSQVVTLQASGCDTLITAATPKFAAQTIRKVFDIGWKPMHFMSNVSVSVASVLTPAGLDKSVGLITGAYLKDPTDPAWKDDPGMSEWRDFMKKALPEADQNDVNYVFAYGVSLTLVQVLKQCGNDFSRENVMKQAASLSHLQLPVALPGIEVNTSATDFRPISQMQLAKFNGKTYERFGTVLSGD